MQKLRLLIAMKKYFWCPHYYREIEQAERGRMLWKSPKSWVKILGSDQNVALVEVNSNASLGLRPRSFAQKIPLHFILINLLIDLATLASLAEFYCPVTNPLSQADLSCVHLCAKGIKVESSSARQCRSQRKKSPRLWVCGQQHRQVHGLEEEEEVFFFVVASNLLLLLGLQSFLRERFSNLA